MCLPVKPFRVEKEWEHAGLKCAVVQAREGSHRCGYVRVPPQHPQFARDYNDINVDVHGGLTFGEIEPCAHEDGQGYWFGFDCNHCQDAAFDPNMRPEDYVTKEGRKFHMFLSKFQYNDNGHFWTLPEVVEETEKLAEELSKL